MTTDELNWLSFRYAAGELDAAEAESFEQRLADDQAAREALARAVELTQVVAAAERGVAVFCAAKHGLDGNASVTPLSRTRTAWGRRVSWMAVGGLASLLLAVLWSGLVGPTWRNARQSIAAASRSELAMAWNQTRDEFAERQNAGDWPSGAGGGWDDESSFLTLVSADEAIADAPSWMMAAVYTEASELEKDTHSFNPEP
jgi:hypothetical protein